MTTIHRKIRQFATPCQYSLLALILMHTGPLRSLAQESHSHMPPATQQEWTPEQQKKESALIKVVREATERFKDVSVAEAEGYALQFGCVSGPDTGAMGLHCEQRRPGCQATPDRDL